VTASLPSAAAPAHAARFGGHLGLGRSLLISATLHAAAVGCSLWIVLGPASRPPGGGAWDQAVICLAETSPETSWTLVEPEAEQAEVEPPEEPPAELVPVEEELLPHPFPAEPALQAIPPVEIPWAQLGVEPLVDLRQLHAQRERERALATAIVSPPAVEAAAAPAGPRGESRPPRLIESPRPAYPRISLRLEEQGAVLLRIHVGADGHVSDVDLLQSSGFERLDQAALAAVRRWRFDPQLRDGEAVAGTFDHRIVFVLERPG